ncbi:MAG TPA: glucose-6-phosphate dehydrogenase assembly protein OpcA [Chthoniobacterales bacterium]|jgi:glucose-6-phosphate dehydrogenase assembly protein OpcA|nr:glucose-6-phosphate dehydrogenase assembly protein OpcA [Chthoniobacterales bacterium]
MVETADNVSLGLPVEIGKIDRELKKLWADGGGAKTRASLINLAVYSEAPGSLPENTRIVSEITEDHACRAIVIEANPAAKEHTVETWINVHCHVSRAGSKQVCSEQLSFLLGGASARLLPNIVFSQLDSDLPFYLWWQGEFTDPMDPQLWAWVDRVIYDSQQWKDFRTQIARVETAQAEARQRMVLCDLNWTRLVQVRLALAQFFDNPATHRQLGEIDKVAIDFAPGFRSTALLLAGWLAAQLEWEEANLRGDHKITFQREKGGPIDVSLNEKQGQPIGRCVLSRRNVEYKVSHSEDADLLDVATGDRNCRMPAGQNETVRLMSEELMRGGPHRVYLRAMNCVRDLL